MSHRPDSNEYYRHSNDSASSFYAHLNINSHGSGHGSEHSNNYQNNFEHTSRYYDQTQRYYDQTQRYYDQTQRYSPDIATQGALDAWAPRRVKRENDYRDPDTFRNPYNDLSRAEQSLHTDGFSAARRHYLQSIKDADGINVNNIREDRRYDVQALEKLNARESRLIEAGASFSQLQPYENQRQQILNNERELNRLYYAPANTRISMGLACIKTGDPYEIMEGQRLIAEAREKRPEIADDPRLQTMIDNAYQIGYRNQHPVERSYEPYRYDQISTRTDAPLQPSNSYPPQSDASSNSPITTRSDATPAQQNSAPSDGSQNRATNRPTDATPSNQQYPAQSDASQAPTGSTSAAPWHPDYNPVPIRPPVNTRPEIPAPPAVQGDGVRPTFQLQENSQSRISDAEALNWLHGKYQHLTIEQKQQNARDAQKAYDETPSSWSPFAVPWENRASENKQNKLLEFSNGFRADLTNLFETSKQPHSYDSDLARQALITIVKNSAQNMSDEAGNREIAEEASAQIKELCRAGANGRREMIDGIRVGLTEASHVSNGTKNNLIDGLELLALDKPPVITADAAARLALLALKHEVDNTPRLGAPDQRGDSRDAITQRQVRLIELLDKLGYKNSLSDLRDLVNSNADDKVREAAAKAMQKLQQQG